MAARGAQRRAWRAQVYDLVAGGQGLTISRYMSPTESRRQFPTLAEHGPGAKELKGTVRAAGLTHSCPLPAIGCAAPLLTQMWQQAGAFGKFELLLYTDSFPNSTSKPPG